MGLMTHRFAVHGLLLGSAMLFAGHAMAADARSVADQLVNLVGRGGTATATYDNAADTPDGITITNFKITDSSDGSSGEIGQIIVKNAADRSPGGFTADSITMGNGRITSDNNVVSWAAATMDQVTVPSAAEASDARFVPFTHFSLDGLNVAGPDLSAPLPINKIDVSLSDVAEGVPHTVKIDLTGLEVPMSVIEDEDQRKAMEQLGYNSFVINFAVDGTYQSDVDSIDVRNIALDIKDFGRLEISGFFSGVPLSKLQSSSGAQELMSSAMINKAQIRFVNTGIVDRFLDMQANAMGASRADLVAQFSSALPLMLNVIGNQGFQDKVAAAATAFLQTPQSLTLIAGPSSPVPVMQLVGAFMNAPQTLPDVLTLDVKANN